MRLGDWLDDRIGHRAALRAWVDRPLVGGASWALAVASLATTCFLVLAATGVVLMTAYAPSPQTAWASVHYSAFVLSRGWIVRGLHYWAAQALIVILGVHLLHAVFVGAYRKPREIAWWMLLAMLGLTLGFAITGGLLPWDNQGWWARRVESNIMGLAPGIGGALQAFMQGGPELGALALTRAYATHVVVLPILFVGALALRRAIVRRHGFAAAAEGESQPWFRQLSRNVVAGVALVFALFAITGYTHGAPLDAPADPLSDYPARPEWFLMPLFQLRKYFHGAGEFWGTTLVPLAAALYLFVLPLIDKGAKARVALRVPVVAIVLGAGALAFIAMRHDARDADFRKARARADERARYAQQLAMAGVPPAGALDMVRNDPELRGHDLFEKSCASCHVLGDMGDPKKATATKLDGWGTEKWIAAMIHDPDAPEFFGRGPYVEKMPSVDAPPKKPNPDEPWVAMVKNKDEFASVVYFLYSQGIEPSDGAPPVDVAKRTAGEKIVHDRCTTCHLYEGKGDDESSGVAPELRGYGSIAWTRAQVTNPATPATYRDKALDEAMKHHMPRFDTELSPADVDLVARWTRAHARGVAGGAQPLPP
jgi:ubiquinol-cytochrome c reductase cytochrome b subunit